jgi:hypothetical protein
MSAVLFAFAFMGYIKRSAARRLFLPLFPVVLKKAALTIKSLQEPK